MALNIVRLGPEYLPNPTIGRPIPNAKIYVGEPDTDPTIEANQKQVSALQEDTSIVPLTQPVNTGAGGVPLHNGSPVTLVVDGNYSLRVDDANDDQLYYVPSVAGFTDASTTIVPIDTIQDLRDYTGEAITASVLGYHTKGDGGGGPTRFLVTGALAGTYVDDGFTTIVPTGGDGSAAWLMDYSGAYNIRWAGAIGDGNSPTEDTAAFTAAIEYLRDVVGGGRIIVPVGHYKITADGFPMMNEDAVGEPWNGFQKISIEGVSQGHYFNQPGGFDTDNVSRIDHLPSAGTPGYLFDYSASSDAVAERGGPFEVKNILFYLGDNSLGALKTNHCIGFFKFSQINIAVDADNLDCNPINIFNSWEFKLSQIYIFYLAPLSVPGGPPTATGTGVIIDNALTGDPGGAINQAIIENVHVRQTAVGMRIGGTASQSHNLNGIVIIGGALEYCNYGLILGEGIETISTIGHHLEHTFINAVRIEGNPNQVNILGAKWNVAYNYGLYAENVLGGSLKGIKMTGLQDNTTFAYFAGVNARNFEVDDIFMSIESGAVNTVGFDADANVSSRDRITLGRNIFYGSAPFNVATEVNTPRKFCHVDPVGGTEFEYTTTGTSLELDAETAETFYFTGGSASDVLKILNGLPGMRRTLIFANGNYTLTNTTSGTDTLRLLSNTNFTPNANDVVVMKYSSILGYWLEESRSQN